MHNAPESDGIPDTLNRTFHAVDDTLSQQCEASEGRVHSGCTAVTAFLRIEDADGKQAFVTPTSPTSISESPGDSSSESTNAEMNEAPAAKKKKSGTSRIKQALKSLGGGSSSSPAGLSSSQPSSPTKTHTVEGFTITTPPSSARRVLYCANAGDARGVLCRNGKAVRLTYDHKGSDKQEAKRITDAGGFVMSGRVNGVLAVTRSLGDSSMKEFVVGSPYTTETELCDDDEFLILACDGVCLVLLTVLYFTDLDLAALGCGKRSGCC